MKKIPKIEKITKKDTSILSRLLFNEDKKYVEYFSPFNNKEHFMETILSSVNDSFYSIKLEKNIIGYISLRGLDEGYDNPRFGIFILKKYSQKGYGYTASKLVLDLCRGEDKFKYVDLKVNPKNKNAIALYTSLGFHFKRKEGSENLMILEFN